VARINLETEPAAGMLEEVRKANEDILEMTLIRL
jgi:hypothetical protein